MRLTLQDIDDIREYCQTNGISMSDRLLELGYGDGLYYSQPRTDARERKGQGRFVEVVAGPQERTYGRNNPRAGVRIEVRRPDGTTVRIDSDDPSAVRAALEAATGTHVQP